MLQHWVVSYDIASQRERNRAVRLLLDHGERVQESVFELRLHPSQWKTLQARLDALMDPVSDQWRAWPLCASDRADMVELGLPARHPAVGAVVV